MIKFIYGFFNKTILALTILLIFFGVFLVHKSVVPFLAKTYLGEYGVTYSKIEGRLINGVRVYDLSYGNGVRAKKLQVEYNILNLLKATPTLTNVQTEGLYLDVDTLPSSDSNESDSELFYFAVKEFELKNSTVIYDKEIYKFSSNGVMLNFDTKLDIQNIDLDLESSYADIKLKGFIKQNKLIADSTVYLSENTKEDYLSFISKTPQKLELKLQADLDKIALQTKVQNLSLKADENLYLENIYLSMIYEKDIFDFEAVYDFFYENNKLKVRQKAKVDANAKYNSTLDIKIIKTDFKHPFKTLQASLDGDVNKIEAFIDAKDLKLNIQSKNYFDYMIKAKSDGLNLSFIKDLPAEFSHDKLSFNSQAKLIIEPFNFSGNMQAEDEFSTTDIEFQVDENRSEVDAIVKLKERNSFSLKYPIQKYSPLKMHYEQTKKRDFLSLSAENLNMIVNKKRNKIQGFAKLGSTEFALHGLVEDNSTNIDINTKIVSLQEFLDVLEVENKSFEYDGEISMNSSLKFEQSFSATSVITIPHYVITTATKELHSLEDISVKLAYKDKILSVENYKAKYKEHSIYSQKQSTIHLKDNGDIDVEEFWVYDNLLVRGLIEPSKKALNLHLKSDKFYYESKEAKLNLKADLKIRMQEGKEYIEGEINILDGQVFYMPPNDYSSMDKDIIVIQDMKLQNSLKRYINVHIDSEKALKYKVKNIDLSVRPNLNLIQEVGEDLKLYGVIGIDKGKVSGAGKEFSFDKSEIYFAGEDPINPQLNLNLHYYTLDYIDIEIYITNTLSSPLVLFSSNPAMTQDDIISYILFGEKASTLFEGSDSSTKVAVGSLLLGTGLKEIFNETSGIQVDTLNILTNEEGTLGYEIGTRFNKNIRVVYKSDTISSVILQYSLSQSTRIDVDVHETGQGVSFIYLKDF